MHGYEEAQHDNQGKGSVIETLRSILSFICLTAFIFFFLMIIINLLILIPGTIITLPYLMNEEFWFYIIFPFILYLFPIQGVTVAIYFLTLVTALFLSFGLIVVKDGWEAKALYIRSFKEMNIPDSLNSFILIPKLFLAVLFFEVSYILILHLLGIEITAPDIESEPLWSLTFGLVNASVYEELITRVLLIGLPLFLFHNIHRCSQTSKEQKPFLRYIVGGDFEIEETALFLILFSSIIFGFAHLHSWDIYKVLPTVIAGIAFGYLFLRKGLFASIIFHFAFDYLAMAPIMIDRGVIKIPDEILSIALLGFFSVLITWSIAGFYYFIVFGRRAIKWLK